MQIYPVRFRPSLGGREILWFCGCYIRLRCHNEETTVAGCVWTFRALSGQLWTAMSKRLLSFSEHSNEKNKISTEPNKSEWA